MSQFAGQAITAVLGKFLTRAAQFVTFIVLARFLSPSDFGIYGIVTTAIALTALAGGLGLRQSLGYWIGQARMTAGEGVSTALALFPLLGAASILVLILLIREYLGPSTTVLLWAVGIAAAGALLISLMQGVSLGRGQIGAFAVGENLPRSVLMLGVLVLLLITQVSLESALWAQAAGFAITVPLAIWLASRHAGIWRVRLDAVLPMIGYGLIFALNLSLLLLGARVSMFFIETSAGAADAGRFFAAVRVNEILLEVATALGMVLFSRAARQKGDQLAIRRNVRISSWLFWFFACGTLLIVPFAPTLITLLAGQSYAPAAPALQILALGLAPAAAAKLIYPTLAGSGRPYFGTPVIVVSLLVNVSLAACLVPSFGLIGGAIALVGGQYCLFIGYVVTCRMYYGVRVGDFLLLRLADAKAFAKALKSLAHEARKRFRRRS